jgi:acyl-CoA thioester hydrolase
MTTPALQEATLAEWHETLLRVRYAETDKMGIVYYANYLVWFEIGRTEYCRARGFSYLDMEESDDAFLVVAESYCRYKAPAYYDDELLIRTHITELRKRSLRFGYEILRVSDGQIIAEGETGHVVTDSGGRVRSFPEGYAQNYLLPRLLRLRQQPETLSPRPWEEIVSSYREVIPLSRSFSCFFALARVICGSWVCCSSEDPRPQKPNKTNRRKTASTASCTPPLLPSLLLP